MPTYFSSGTYIQTESDTSLESTFAAPQVVFLNSVSISGVAGKAGLNSQHVPATDYIVIGQVNQEGTGFTAGAIVRIVVTISNATSYVIETDGAYTDASGFGSTFSSSASSYSASYPYEFIVTMNRSDFWFSVTGNGFAANTNMGFGVTIDKIGDDPNSADWGTLTVRTPSGGSATPTGPITPVVPSNYGYHPVSTSIGSFVGSVASINNKNQVTANLSVSGLIASFPGALIGPGGQTTIVLDPSAGATHVYGVNNRGQAVGSYVVSAYANPQTLHGFVYSNGAYATLDDPLATQTTGSVFPSGTVATGINDSGTVVGYYYTATPNTAAVPNTVAFSYTNGIYSNINVPNSVAGTTKINAINNNGDLVGTYTPVGGTDTGFLYHNGKFTNLTEPGSYTSLIPKGINNTGEVVGLVVGLYGYQAFTYRSGAYTNYTFPGGGNTEFTGVNDAGYISGSYVYAGSTVNFIRQPFIQHDFVGAGTSGVLLQNGNTVVDWVLNNGAYRSGNVLAESSGYGVIGSGDFNADGTADVLLQNGSSVVDWIMQNGAYQSGNVLANSSGYKVVGTGDFNADGTSDVLLQSGNSVVDWILQNGAYQSGNVLANSSGYAVVGTGDFNADGTTDVLLQSGSSVVDWIMKNGAYQSGSVLANSAGYSVVGTGDFNGDGTTDVLLQSGSSVIDWILGNGAYQGGNVIAGSSGYQVVGTGDYNSDGTTDILLQSGSSVVQWTMQNGAYQSGAILANSSGFAVKI